MRPGIMPTLFGQHMIGNTIFITLDEMAEGLPDMFEYIGGECPPPPEPTGDAEFDEANLDRYERMKAFWVDTACNMEPAQKPSTTASSRPWTSRPRNCSSGAA